jgi:hypothetical protein
MLKSFVAKTQPVVDIPDVTYEQIVVGQRFVEIDGPNLFTENNHKA